MKRIVSLLSLSLLLTSCATLLNGPDENVTVESDPPGAIVTDGKTVSITPATLVLERNRDYELTIIKCGYQAKEVEIKHVISGVEAGNLVSFGAMGIAIDLATGAAWHLEPDHIMVMLQPLNESTPENRPERLDAATLQRNLEELDYLRKSSLLTENQYNTIRNIMIHCVKSPT